MVNRKFINWLTVSFVFLGLPTLSQALEIDIVFYEDEDLTINELVAARRAADAIEPLFNDPITVTIRVGSLNSQFEPSADDPVDLENAKRASWISKVIPCLVEFEYSAFTASLLLDADGFAERTVANQMNSINTIIRTAPLVEAHRFRFTHNFYSDSDGHTWGAEESEFVNLTCANAKALGLGFYRSEPLPDEPARPWPMHRFEFGHPEALVAHGYPEDVDGVIYLNRDYREDFLTDRSFGIFQEQIDLQNVIMHDIAHILGFVSMVDVHLTGDERDHDNLTNIHASAFDAWRFTTGAGLLYRHRYEHRMLGLRAVEYDNGTIVRPLSMGLLATDPQCSLPDGHCSASHWQDGTGTLMDPKIYPGEIRGVSDDERMVLDFLGYDATTTSLPVTTYETEGPGVIVTGAETQWDPSRRFFPVYEGDASSESQEHIDPYRERFNQAAQNFSFTGQMQMPDSKEMADLNLTIRWAPALEFFGPKVSQPEPNPDQDEILVLAQQPPTQHPLRILSMVMEASTETGGFGFASSLPVRGLEFNPHLGEFGGFTVTGFVDGWSNDVSEAVGQLRFNILLTQNGDFTEQSSLVFADMHWRINEPSAFDIKLE